MRSLTKFVPVLAIFGTVTAISAAPDQAPVPPAATAGSATGSGSGSGSATTPAPAPAPAPSLSNADMQTRAVAIQAQLDDDMQYVLHLKEMAKKQKDVIKLNCVNDRLVQLKAQRNIADDTNTQLTAAISTNSDTRQQLYIQLNGVAESSKALREQAARCIGEPELFKQENGVEVTHPDIPDDPGLDVFGTEIEPPGYASGFD